MEQTEELGVAVIKVEVGKKSTLLREVRTLKVGEVITLDTKAGSLLKIYADGRFIGNGEAVVVGDRYGVRIIDIVPPDER